MTSSPRSTATPAAPVRAPVRDIGAGSATSVQTSFDARTAFDFAISLATEIGGRDELPEEDRRWLEKGRAALPAAVRAALDNQLTNSAASLIVDRPEVTDAEAVVTMLRGMPGRELAASVLTEDLRDPGRRAAALAALDGDVEAIRASCECWPEHKQAWLERLLQSPDEVLGEIRAVMAAWLPTYQERESRIRNIIERDVDLRASDRATLGPVDLIERTTNGVRWLSEPGIRRVILAPSYLVRPYNFVYLGADWRMFVYPVADSALEPQDPLDPPIAVLRLHRALGDETRLRILRLLRDRDLYLTEIAERLGLSKPTISHHLALLRAAGLVSLTEEGGLSYYSLRRDRLDDASGELKHFLLP